MPQQIMLSAIPSSLVARFFLTPDDLGRAFVFFDLRFEIIVREWIKLRDAHQRNILDTAFATACAQVVKYLAAAEYDALHFLGVDVVVPLLVYRLDLVVGEFFERRHGFLVAQQALG